MSRASAKLQLSEQLAEERRRVDFDSYDITVQQLLLMVAKHQIDVAPVYQRRFRWGETRQSQLIESIFLGIPIPNLFMATNKDGTWEVVDGVQRLNTLVHFAGDDGARSTLGLDHSLRVAGLKKVTAMNGVTFGELPEPAQTQFVLRPIKVTTLNDKSDLKVRFDLFERLNTGGVSLTDQEIRGCIYRGAFNEFLERMAKDDDFRKVVLLRESMERDGTREEYVLRFFAFLHGYRTFVHSVVGFLNDYMASASKSFDYGAGEDVFHKTFSELRRVLPAGIKRRSRVTPVNLFEAVAVGAAVALSSRKRLRAGTASEWVESEELHAMTTGATNNRARVVERIEYAAKRFGVD